MRGALIVLGGLLLAACGTPPRTPPAEPLPAERESLPASPVFSEETRRYLARRNIKPQVVRPLNVQSSCRQRDELGNVTRLELLVRDAEVHTLQAEIDIKRHGSCRFALQDFEQEARLPQTLLRHRKQRECTLRLWEQGDNVTLAFNSCRQSCDGKAFDYLWPVLVDARSGRCH